MKRIYILPLIAVLGLLIAVAAIIYGNQPARVSTRSMQAFPPPFDSYVAGSGIVEPTTGNIAIGTPVSGVVTEIYVNVGDEVKAGDPLFKVDDRDLQSQLLTADARVEEATASLREPRHQLQYSEQLKKRDPNAVNAHDLAILRDGVAVAESTLTMAEAQRSQIQMEIERHTVRALVAGKILQLKMRLGEYVESSSTVTPLLILGGNERLNLRVDVDEHDAWRIKPGAQAIAFVRGYPDLKIPLRFEYTEPYIIPKTALTGQSTERTDTRVLQVIYSFEHSELPVYIGQLLDVYIQAPATGDAPARP